MSEKFAWYAQPNTLTSHNHVPVTVCSQSRMATNIYVFRPRAAVPAKSISVNDNENGELSVLWIVLHSSPEMNFYQRVGVFVVNKDNVVNVLQIKLCWLMVKIE